MKATPKEHISHPPAYEATWYYRLRGDPLVYHLQARTWFAAREKVMSVRGCEPGSIEIWQSKSLEEDVARIWSEKKCTP